MAEEDHCVYVKIVQEKLPYPIMYVDSNILLAGNNRAMIVATKVWLSSNFKMKDIGEANYVLKVKISRYH